MNTSKINLDLNKIRDILLYGAIVWLIGEKFIFKYIAESLLLAGLVVLPIVIILAYLILRIRKLNTEFFMETPNC